MRITCPGCGSAYEVPDRAVPDPGRDMQCAACGESWYLLKGGAPSPATNQTADAPPARHVGANRSEDRQAGTQTRAQAGAAADGVAGGSAGSPPDGGADGDADGRTDDPDGERAKPGNGSTAGAEAQGGLPPPRRVDPAVLAILRAEAETERRARAAAGAAHAHPMPRDAQDAAAPAHAPGSAADGRAAAHGDQVADAARDRPDPIAATATGGPPPDPAGDALDTRGRLARLTAAERRGAGSHGAAGGWARPDDAMDHGLIEDPDPARHGLRPPLLGTIATDRPTRDHTHGLPVTTTSGGNRALVVLERRRRGFRLGFAATAGLCCAALAVYLVALRAGAGWDGPVLDAVRHHGGQVQAALVDWLRRVVVPALS